MNTSWLSLPVLLNDKLISSSTDSNFQMVHPESDTEIRAVTITLNTSVKPRVRLSPHRFECFSKRSSVVRAIAHLIHIANQFANHSSTESVTSGTSVKAPPQLRKSFKQKGLLSNVSKMKCTDKRLLTY